MDHGADDISISQAVRQVGQILPQSVLVTVYPDREAIDLYRSGHGIGMAQSLEVALRE